VGGDGAQLIIKIISCGQEYGRILLWQGVDFVPFKSKEYIDEMKVQIPEDKDHK